MFGDHQRLEGEDDSDELDEFDDVLPLRSGIFSGEGERDGRKMDGVTVLETVDEAVDVDVDGDEEETFWRRDWFHDV
ncbi:hypothetical protein ACHAQJ_004526 [Trichoderma viride]